MRTREMLAYARHSGKLAGEASASWVFDGNTTDETFIRVLRGLEDGDPEILDSLTPPNLSGEWADGETPATLAEAVALTPDDHRYEWVLDDICNEWEIAATDAFFAEVERTCRNHVAYILAQRRAAS